MWKTKPILSAAMMAVVWATVGCDTTESRAERMASFDTAANLGLEEAIAVAAQDGDFVTDVELDSEDGEFEYEMVVLRGGDLYEIALDPETGAVLSTEFEDDNDDAEHKARIAGIDQAANIGAEEAAAIGVAEKGGFAVQVELDVEDPDPTWEVTVYTEGVLWEVEIDPADGSVLEVEEDEGEEE